MFNLAGRLDCDKFIEVELESSGYEILALPHNSRNRGEVAWSKYAEFRGWTFTRAWSYWIASCENSYDKIPKEEAKALNKKWGKQIRVEGFAGGKEVENDVSCYHIDTLAGLQEFWTFLNSRYQATVKDIEIKYQKTNIEQYGILLRSYLKSDN